VSQYHATVTRAEVYEAEVADPPERNRIPRLGVVIATFVAVALLGVGIPAYSLLTGPSGPFGAAPAPNDPRPDGQLPVVHLSNDATAGSPSQTASPSASPSPAATHSPAPGPSPTAAHSPAPGPPSAAHLQAQYVTTGSRGPLGAKGYDGVVTITNPGGATVPGWTVTITLYLGQQVTRVSGASYQQNGTTVTFTGTQPIKGQGQVAFRFAVNSTVGGPTQPASCSIEGRHCT
jgi:hypothetical protein